jgi:hypothetical protein
MAGCIPGEMRLTLHHTLYAAANPVNNVAPYGYAFIEADGGGSGGSGAVDPVDPVDPVPQNPARWDLPAYDVDDPRPSGGGGGGHRGGGGDDPEEEPGDLSLRVLRSRDLWGGPETPNPLLLTEIGLQPVGLSHFQIQASEVLVSTVDYDPLNPYIPPPCPAGDWWCQHEMEITLGVVGVVSFGIPLMVAYGPAVLTSVATFMLTLGEQALERAEQAAYGLQNWSMYHPQETVVAYNAAETAFECAVEGCTPETAAMNLMFGSLMDYPQGLSYGGAYVASPYPEDVPLRQGPELEVELGPGYGSNLIRIAQSRPNAMVVGLELDSEAVRFAQLDASMSDVGDRIMAVRADYTRPPLPTVADEVIAVAPGSRTQDVLRATTSAGEIVGPGGRIYVVTDLNTFIQAKMILEES